jgi:integrase
MKLKKIMLGHIKGKRNQRAYAEQMMERLTRKLINGWNPFVEKESPLEYTLFKDVCNKYKEYVFKMVDTDDMREQSAASYLSKLNVITEWVETKKIGLNYAYQLDKEMVGRLLDYVFIDRNNTLQTRNNYLSWLKTFCGYMLQRSYLKTDPTVGFNQTHRRGGKNRRTLPDEKLVALHDYLMIKNKHYLLACYLLHYVFVRPHEMAQLTISNISLKNQTLYISGKISKNRNDATVTLPKKVIQLMLDLNLFSNPGQYYIFSDDFRPGKEQRSEKAFRDFWIKHVRKDLDFDDQYKFYSLKDTGITNMLRANTDIISVRDQARHSSILITDIYTPKDIKKANKLILNYEGVF